MRSNGTGRSLLGLFGTIAALAATTGAQAQERVDASIGMVAYRVNGSMADALERVEPAIKSRGLFVMRILDHSAAAAQFGRQLNPNAVVLFGNPEVGSQVMTCSPRAGIDLPQKLLIWEENGGTLVAYNDPAHLVWRHAIGGCDAVLEKVRENLDGIARQVAGG